MKHLLLLLLTAVLLTSCSAEAEIPAEQAVTETELALTETETAAPETTNTAGKDIAGMKQYTVHTVSEVDWSKAETAEISTFKWRGDYAPETYAQLLVVKDKGLAAKFTCYEKEPRAVYTDFYDAVYTDSCMEFFFQFDRKGVYVNCEMNANGAALIGVGAARGERVRLDEITEPPIVTANTAADYWTVEVFFDIPVLKAMFGDISLDSGTVFYGNFYKCGDSTAEPHYGMWAEVKLSAPDFHVPEFFGALIID